MLPLCPAFSYCAIVLPVFLLPLPMTINYAQLWEALGGTNLFLPLKARTHIEMMTRHVFGRRPVVMLLSKGQDTFLPASSLQHYPCLRLDASQGPLQSPSLGPTFLSHEAISQSCHSNSVDTSRTNILYKTKSSLGISFIIC